MTFVRDVALAVRSLLKHRGFSLAVVLTLGIAVAATSVVVATVDQALWRPLPYRDPSQLLLLWERTRGDDMRLASYPTYLDWQRSNLRSFAGLAYARGSQEIMPTRDGPLRLTVAYVSAGFFGTLGVAPVVGRGFSRDEELPGRGETVVISNRFWHSEFGGDAAAVGRSVQLGKRAVTIVGVMPPGATYPPWADMWRPITAVIGTDPALASRNHHSDSRVLARLRPGVTPEVAVAELAGIERRLANEVPDQGTDWTSAAFRPLSWEFVGDSKPALSALLGAVALVLLVACVNVATLLLLRAIARDRELAIRSALGAGTGTLARSAFVEFAVLVAAAGCVGALLTWWGLALLRVAAPGMMPRAAELGFDGRVAGLIVTLTVVAAILVAVVPVGRVIRSTGRSAFEALRAGWQPTSGGRAGTRLRSMLASAQLALALALLAGAGLLLESFRRLAETNVGFDARNLAVFWVSPPSPRYDAPEQAARLYERVQEAAAAVPGVVGATIVNHVPLAGGWISTKVVVPGMAPVADGSDAALYKTVSESYLRVMRGRLLRGRWFNADDLRGAGLGVVVNETMARQFWPNDNPVGRPLTIFRSSQLRAGFGDPSPSVVVGVVADMRHLSVADDPVSEVYVPYTREVWPGIGLLIRSRGDPRAVELALRRAILAVEPDLPVRGSTARRGFQTMDDLIGAGLQSRRSVAGLVLGFAIAALLLSAIGVYGVTSFSVAQRSREFGIRMAVGATSGNLLRLVVGEGARLAVIGVVIGLAGAAVMTRVLRASLDSLLYRTSPFALAPLGAAAAALLAVAVAAAWAPARRASRVDPILALRSE